MKAIDRAYAGYGDGDICPLDSEHGKMYVARDRVTQRCIHQSHDGSPKTAPGGERPATRAVWPFGPDSFAKAVEETVGATA